MQLHCVRSVMQRAQTRSASILMSNSLNSNGTKLDPGRALTWYTCGPTVYDQAHLGHARSYVSIDIIRRILVNYYHIPIDFALGMTDIDDKIIQRCVDQTAGQCSHQDIDSLTKKYEVEFLSDMKKLNVISPNVILRVTEHIPAIIQYIEEIIRNDYAYITDDGVYFDVGKCKNYGKLGSIPTVNDEFTSREHVHAKKNPRDFVLWKYVSNKNEPVWTSPWGNGRPGWHIECSAMTHSYFGPHIHIHSGGIDLKFPHHTNEIAQSEAHNTSDSWVDTWLHTGHLYIEGRKMSKSLKNFISIDNYFKANITSHPGVDFRLFCMQSRYSHNVYYTTDRIHDAAKYRNKIENYLQLTEQLVRHIETSKKEVAASPSSGRNVKDAPVGDVCTYGYVHGKKLTKALNEVKVKVDEALRDDFDTPTVLDSISSLVSDAQQYRVHLTGNSLTGPLEPLVAISDYIIYLFDIFGIELKEQQASREQAEQGAIVSDLIKFRSNIRHIALSNIKKNENSDICKSIMKKCDEVRDQLKEHHVVVEDTKDSGGLWRYNNSK